VIACLDARKGEGMDAGRPYGSWLPCRPTSSVDVPARGVLNYQSGRSGVMIMPKDIETSLFTRFLQQSMDAGGRREQTAPEYLSAWILEEIKRPTIKFSNRRPRYRIWVFDPHSTHQNCIV